MKSNSNPGKDSNSRALVWLGIIIVALTAAAYWPALSNDFVNYDDHLYVTENVQVQNGLSWQGFTWAMTTGAVANWHPLTWLSHMLDCELFGLNPKGHHASSLILHAINSVLVLIFMYMATGWRWRSGFIGAVFAVHPLHVESVVWISERKDLLSGFFCLVSLLAYLGYARKRMARAESRANQPSTVQIGCLYCLTLITFLLGLMSKPMLVTLPFVFLLIDYWPAGRCQTLMGKTLLSEWRGPILEKLPFFLITVGACLITLMTQRQGHAFSMGDALPLSERLANAIVSYCRYLKMMVWPTDLAAFYPYTPHGWLPATAAFVVVAGITGLLWWRRKNYSNSIVGWFWYLGMLVPVIGLVQVGAQSHADRYMYLPLLGLLLALPWQRMTAKPKSWAQVIVLCLCAGLLVCLTSLTRTQSGQWKNSVTLWRNALQHNPDNPLAHYSLGLALGWSNQVDQAANHLAEAVKIWPTYAPALGDLGQIRARQGRSDEAIELYQKAISLAPHQALTHYNLGLAWQSKGEPTKAIPCFEEVLRLDPQFEDAQLQLGVSLFSTGQTERALNIMNQILIRKSDNFTALLCAGQAFNLLNQHEEAREMLEHANQLQPNNPLVIQSLALTLESLHLWPEAIQQYRAALNCNSNLVVSLNNLAWILASHPNPDFRDGAQAVELAKHACELTHSQVTMMMGTLAAAYAEAGRFDEAVATGKKACALATKRGETELLKRNQELLALYQAGKPYHEK